MDSADADGNSNTSSYFHHRRPNGTIMFSPNPNPNSSSASAGEPPRPTPLLFPHSVAGRASAAPEPVKRKRGRPRKYGASHPSSLSTPPRSLSSLSLPSPVPHSSPRSKKDFPSVSPKKAQLTALGKPYSLSLSQAFSLLSSSFSSLKKKKNWVSMHDGPLELGTCNK